MKRVNYHLTEQQIAELQDLHEKTGLAVAEMIRRAVDAYIELEKEKETRGQASHKNEGVPAS